MANGHDAPHHYKATLVLGGGTLLALTTLLINLFVTVSKDAQIAIEVAKQHGDELLMIRGEIASLRQTITDRTNDRYTSKQAERDMQYIERRLTEFEKQLNGK